jgi:DNA invertase Pin-like site-specific DNA recombinase
MSKPPDPIMVSRATRLIREHRPQREIARITGLDRSTVRRIAAESEAKPPRTDARQ